jgi:hypothetical protein
MYIILNTILPSHCGTLSGNPAAVQPTRTLGVRVTGGHGGCQCTMILHINIDVHYASAIRVLIDAGGYRDR